MRTLRFLFAALGLSACCAHASIPIVFESQPHPPRQFHDGIYKLGWDLDFSPYAGGEDVLFVHRSLERMEGWLVGKSPVYYSKEAAARLWRLGELVLVWLPINYLGIVVQHEIFGHGYRIRDIGNQRAHVTGYSFGTPPPYGHGGGATAYRVYEDLTTTEETSIAMAGVESTAILAQTTKLKWLETNWIDPRQAILYLLSQQDITLYIGSLNTEGTLEGHDMKGYVRSLNYTYTARPLSCGRLRTLSWINLADPFTYYAVYSWFHYLSAGKESKIPMIPIWDWGYLPGLRLGLTPFGPEIFVENYLLRGDRPVYFYGKGGHHSHNGYYGVGLFAPKLWLRHRWSFGARIDSWWQPKLLLQPAATSILDIDFDEKPDPNNPLYSYPEQYKKRWGAAGSFLAAYFSRRVGFEAEFGYKAQGFLPGYALRASPVSRLFFSLRF